MSLRKFLLGNDLAGIRQALATNPALANEGLPYDERTTTKAHPLHRICDDVFNNLYSDGEAVILARLFLAAGAQVDGFGLVDYRDTPLLAAASLLAEQVGILYVDSGATIDHRGASGGTALHWAAWTGQDKLVKRLLDAGADVHKRCTEFTSTPLLWAVHGYQTGGKNNRHNQVECVRLLRASGADETTPGKEGKRPIDLLDPRDTAMRQVLS